MKKRLFIISCCMVMLNIFNVKASNNQINIIVNGNSVEFTNETGYPYVDSSNRTMVPLRVTMEAAGATVGYDTNNQTAIVITEHDRIEVPVGTDYLYNNNLKIQNDTTAVINNGRVYLPIRAVLECANYTVEWDKNTQTVNAYNFTFNNSDFIPYSTSDLRTLTENVIKGNVVYINGQYYATPDYVKRFNNTVFHYSGNDLNSAIYPQADRFASANMEASDFEWISGITNFDKILVDEKTLDKSIKTEKSDIPGFVYVYCFYENSSTNIKVIYPVDEITDNFMSSDNASGEFNGIKMKKENGILYFDYNDLVRLGLYK